MPDQHPPIPLEPIPRKPIRWWPAGVICLLAGFAVLIVRNFGEATHQERNIRTAVALVCSSGLLLLWWLFFSRVRWMLRLIAVACLGLAGLLIKQFFVIHGVSGDLVPIVELRRRAIVTPQLESAQISATRANLETVTGSFPQFLGPDRNGVLVGPKLESDWKSQPPRLLWRKPVGAAWSGFAVQGAIAITQEQLGEEESVVAYETTTGRTLWTHRDRAHYHTVIAGEGPRATPTISGDRVFTQGATGLLNCLDLKSGRLLWSHDIVRENHAKLDGWGFAGSPLAMGEKVIVNPGGPDGHSLVAYHRDTGARIWSAGNDVAGYSSPILVSLAGAAQILIFNQGALFAHEPERGKILWRYPWPTNHPHVTLPLIVASNQVLVATGYGNGAELLQIDPGPNATMTPRRVWKSNRLKPKFANLIRRDGFVYGLDDGIFVCVEIATGQLRWKEGRYGHGQILLVDQLLLIMAESGDLVLFEPRPDTPRELARFPVLTGKTWNPPALAGDLLLMRNDREAACFRLPVNRSAPSK